MRRRLVHAGRVLRRQVAHDVVDREEAGVLRQQAVLQAQLGDALAMAVAAFQRLLVRRRGDAMARPEASAAPPCPGAMCAPTRDGVAVGAGRRSGLRSRPGRGPRRATCRTRSPGARPARRAVAAGSTSYTSRPSNRAFTLVSTGDSIMRRKRAASAARLHRVGDDEGLAHAGARQAFHQVAVDGRADAEGKHVGLRQVPAHQLEGLALHRHVAVGHHHHGARHVGRLGLGVDALERGNQLGAAAAAASAGWCGWPARCWRAWPAPNAATACGCCRRTAAR